MSGGPFELGYREVRLRNTFSLFCRFAVELTLITFISMTSCTLEMSPIVVGRTMPKSKLGLSSAGNGFVCVVALEALCRWRFFFIRVM